jgi:hypothetical protein
LTLELPVISSSAYAICGAAAKASR